MDLFMYLSVPIIMILAHYVGLHFEVKNRNFRVVLQSITAGFSVGYVFLLLIPEAIQENIKVEDTLTLAFIGFTVFHSATKFIFQHARKNKKIIFIEEIHLITVGLYNFLLSFLVIEVLKAGDLERGVLLIFVLAIHHMLSDMSHKDLHIPKIDKLKSATIVVSNLAGAALATTSQLPADVVQLLFAFATGAILYITIREEIPNENEGKPIYFVVGGLIIIFLMTIT